MMFLISVLVGGVAAYALGVVWYMTLGSLWMKAARLTSEQLSSDAPGFQVNQGLAYGLTFLMWLFASFVMQAHLLPMAVAAGVNPFRAVVGMWIAFGLLSTLLSTLYGFRGKNLIWIDAGYVLCGSLLITAAFVLLN